MYFFAVPSDLKTIGWDIMIYVCVDLALQPNK